MSKLFEDLTQATEQLIRQALTVKDAIFPAEMLVREAMARKVLDVWSETLAPLMSTRDDVLNLNAERDRLEELIFEMAAMLLAKEEQ